jgi:hypothetical protein
MLDDIDVPREIVEQQVSDIDSGFRVDAVHKFAKKSRETNERTPPEATPGSSR